MLIVWGCFKFTIDRFDHNNIHFLDIANDKKAKLIYTTNPLILLNIVTSRAMFFGIIKFHGLNPFTTKQIKFVHQR